MEVEWWPVITHTLQKSHIEFDTANRSNVLLFYKSDLNLMNPYEMRFISCQTMWVRTLHISLCRFKERDNSLIYTAHWLRHPPTQRASNFYNLLLNIHHQRHAYKCLIKQSTSRRNLSVGFLFAFKTWAMCVCVWHWLTQTIREKNKTEHKM